MATLLTDVTRTARKPHKCCLCRTTIHPGDKYRYTSCADEGTVWSNHEHKACVAFMENHPDWWDAFEGWDSECFEALVCEHPDEAERRGIRLPPFAHPNQLSILESTK